MKRRIAIKIGLAGACGLIASLFTRSSAGTTTQASLEPVDHRKIGYCGGPNRVFHNDPRWLNWEIGQNKYRGQRDAWSPMEHTTGASYVILRLCHMSRRINVPNAVFKRQEIVDAVHFYPLNTVTDCQDALGSLAYLREGLILSKTEQESYQSMLTAISDIRKSKE